MQKTKNSLRLATAGLATVAALSGIGGAVGAASAQEEADQDFSHAAASNQADYDLEPYFQTSGTKAKGFAGTVVLKVKNVGSPQARATRATRKAPTGKPVGSLKNFQLSPWGSRPGD